MTRGRALAAVAGAAALVAIIGHVVMAHDTPTPIISALRIATVPGMSPSSATVDEQTGRVFVANASNQNVSVLDAASGQWLRTVPVEGMPALVAVDAPLHRVLVVPWARQYSTARITVLDARSGAVLGTVPASAQTIALAVDRRTGRAFSIIAGTDAMSVLDVAHRRIVRSVFVGSDHSLGYNPYAVAVDARTDRVFVANESTPSVSMFDGRTGTRLRTVSIGHLCTGCYAQPTAIAVDEQSGRVFVCSQSANTVSMFDARSGALLRTVPVSKYSSLIALDAHAGRVFVNGVNTSILDARSGTLISTIQSYSALAVDGRTSRLFAFRTPVDVQTSVAWGWVPSWLRRLLPWLPAAQTVTSSAPLPLPSVGEFDTRTGALLRILSVSDRGPVVVDERTGRVFVLTTTPAGKGLVSVFDATK